MVEHNSIRKGIQGHKPSLWEQLVCNKEVALQPKIILEIWRGKVHLWKFVPASKSSVQDWNEIRLNT